MLVVSGRFDRITLIILGGVALERGGLRRRAVSASNLTTLLLNILQLLDLWSGLVSLLLPTPALNDGAMP